MAAKITNPPTAPISIGFNPRRIGSKKPTIVPAMMGFQTSSLRRMRCSKQSKIENVPPQIPNALAVRGARFPMFNRLALSLFPFGACHEPCEKRVFVSTLLAFLSLCLLSHLDAVPQGASHKSQCKAASAVAEHPQRTRLALVRRRSLHESASLSTSVRWEHNLH